MIPGWKEEIHQDYLQFLRRRRRTSPPELAAHLKISESNAVYWLTDLARDGKVRILAVEVVEEESTEESPRTVYSPEPEEAELTAV